MRTPARAHIVFLISEDWYFVSHRLRLAEAAVARGYRVSLVSRFSEHRRRIDEAGLGTVPFDIGRSGTSPVSSAKNLVRLQQIYRRLAPDIVYQVALKPVLVGSLAARLAGVHRRVNAPGGLGFLFGDVADDHKVLRMAARLAMMLLLRRDETIVQNPADLAVLQTASIPADRLHLIPGAGVDLQAFQRKPEPGSSPVVVTLVSRMLWEKGVGELVEAARLLRARDIDTRLQLVGRPDPENPGSINEAQLSAWHAEGIVSWHGHSDDIPTIWADSHIAVLPSYYREGLPKSLMEAAACGRPIVTTDFPGCRDAIVPNRSGLLVPPRDPLALADALQQLIEDPERRQAMGAYARRDAEERFSDSRINARILDICDGLLVRGPS